MLRALFAEPEEFECMLRNGLEAMRMLEHFFFKRRYIARLYLLHDPAIRADEMVVMPVREFITNDRILESNLAYEPRTHERLHRAIYSDEIHTLHLRVKCIHR